jgi:hypothetical protein
VPVDRVLDAVREDRALPGPGLLLEVVGHPGADGLARHLLAPVPGVEAEPEVGAPPADGLEELDAVLAGHMVVADDAVDPLVEPFEPRPGVHRRLDVQALALPLEVGGRHLGEPGLVIDVQDADAVVARRHRRAGCPPLFRLDYRFELRSEDCVTPSRSGEGPREGRGEARDRG